MPPEKKGRILILDQPHPIFFDLVKEDWELDLQLEAAREEILSLVKEYDGLVIRSRIKIDADFVQAANALKFIGRLGVGIEHIDLEACQAKGIAVLTTPEGSRDAVGEHTLGLMLGLMNHLFRADRQIREGKWLRKSNTGTEIKGKTIGLLGYGNMGQAVAKRLSGFGAEVIAYDKFRTDYGDSFAEAVDLETLQEKSQVLSIHIPYMPQNHHFVDGAFLDRFQHPLFLINTARGTVLHTQDLVKRLQNGKILGAALDVIEYEEMSFSTLEPDKLPAPFQWLRQSDRVILNPHIAGWSHESAEGHARVLAEKINLLMSSPTPFPKQKPFEKQTT